MQNSNVKYIKIHPAIGVARLANNDHYFEFFEAHARNFSPPNDFMSAGGPDDPKPGMLRLKKQAVQFKAFAYDENNNLIGEVKDVFPDATVHWSADVGNRKLFNYSSKIDGGEVIAPVTAQATASSPDERAELNGVSPWNSNQPINLGSITGKGLFIPGKGGVARKNTTSTIAPYPANQSENLDTTDTSCDGEISAAIFDEAGNKMNIQVMSAWVISAPSQHCLTLTPATASKVKEDFGAINPNNRNNNNNWIETTKLLLDITGDIDDPTGLDLPMMLTMNGDYNPGMEVNLGSNSYMEKGLSAKNLFYPRGIGFIGKNEIRVQSNAVSSGAAPGQLTSGLCSTWQGDMKACLNWWTAENPSNAYGADNSIKVLIYEEGNTNRQMDNPEEINEHMDFRGIADYKTDEDDIEINLTYDPNRP